jgi:hypothetical protein
MPARTIKKKRDFTHSVKRKHPRMRSAMMRGRGMVMDLLIQKGGPLALQAIQGAIDSNNKNAAMTGSGLSDILDKALGVVEKGSNIYDKASEFVSSEDFNNIRNGVSGVMGLARAKNPLSRSLYPGEKHGVVLSGPYKGTTYNFLGPGTRIRERINRGDQPINDVDAAAKAHDLAYLRAKTAADVVNADKAVIRAFEQATDDPVMARAAIRMMKIKMAGQRGIHIGLDPMKFAGASPPIYRDEIGEEAAGGGNEYYDEGDGLDGMDVDGLIGSGRYPGSKLRKYAARQMGKGKRRHR